MKIPLVKLVLLFAFSMLLVGCSSKKTIVHGIQEREANAIVVLLHSKNIEASKIQSSEGGGTGAQKVVLWDIEIPSDHAIEAMNYLDQEGLPRKHSENLLDIFGNAGLVPSESQEKIRYQAGLAQEIANTINKIDGILDANVIISFPEEDPLTGKTKGTLTASVYVKHNGVLDDPNMQLKTKIKRLVAASVTGLNYDNITVIGDRAKITENSDEIQKNKETPELTNIWSIELAKGSVSYFRLIFFLLLSSNIIFIAFIIWFSWKFYPLLKEISFRRFFDIKQINIEKTDAKEKPEESKIKDTEKEIDDI